MLLIQLIRLLTMAHPSSLPCTVDGWWMMGPTPLAFTMHQMKKVMPAVGATIAFRVNRWRILWIGNQIAGREMSQKRKKHMKSRVVVPEDAGRWLATVSPHVSTKMFVAPVESDARIFCTLGHIDRSMTFMHVPPMLDWTPYQILEVELSVCFCYKRAVNSPCHCTAIEHAPQAAP